MNKTIEITPYVNYLQLQYIPRHKISYLEFGNPNNENIIVCAPGLTRNAHDFEKIAGFLEKDFRVISLSYPGRGESDYFTNKKHYNYQVYLKDSLQVIKKLNIKNPVWLGTSMGGIIGMAIASKYPNLLKGLILNDIGPFIPAAALIKIKKYTSQTPVFDDFKAAKQHLKIMYNSFGITNEEDWDHITKHSIISNKEGKYQMHYDKAITEGMKVSSTKLKNINIWQIWHKIICPLMVIQGARSDILLNSTIEEMKKAKNFELYVVDYAGHAPALTNMDQINAIKTWLDKLRNLKND